VKDVWFRSEAAGAWREELRVPVKFGMCWILRGLVHEWECARGHVLALE
jgi:hypothetical protein